MRYSQDGDPVSWGAAEEQALEEAWVGGVPRLDGPVHLVEYDPAWPALFERETERIRSALGDQVLRLEHVGSTSVPGLAAKPRIDILLVIAGPADESRYVPALQRAGYRLVIREPNWYEHRAFKGPDTDVNLHVHPPHSPEIARNLRFRDRLRSNESDRLLYQRTKRELAARRWTYVQQYADAKSEVIEAILSRGESAGAGSAHLVAAPGDATGAERGQ